MQLDSTNIPADDASQGLIAAAISQAHTHPLVKEAFDLLTRELPDNLVYHAKSHTEDVLHEAIRFGIMDKLSAREVEILAIAAAFHDTGFTRSPVANETIGAEFARKAMAHAGTFSEEEIRLVEQMILDTTLVELPNGPQQIPSTNLSRYLLDADLSNLGRDDFFDKGELQRQELKIDESHFRKRSLQLLTAHRWFTNAAHSLRQKKKDQNLLLLQSMISPIQHGVALSFDRVGFLAKLPLLLNASLDTRKVIKASLNELKTRLGAEAATIFLFDHSDNTLCFWAMHGPDNEQLERTKIPSNRGCVGWVLDHQQPILVNDASSDPRFLREIDENSGFVTRNLICAPLSVRMADKLGAVEVLNKLPGLFEHEDLEFLTQFANQIALAIENATLYESMKERSRQLEILDQRKTEVMQLIAQEFRDPIQLLGRSAKQLDHIDLKDTAMIDKMRQGISAGVERLTDLISEIKTLAIATSPSFAVDRARIAVSPLVESVVRTFKHSAQDRGIDLTHVVTTDALHVEGDEELLNLCLSHLVSNAIYYTPKQGRVHVKVFQNGGLIHFEVRDSGIGIDSEQQSLIFEKFYRVDSSRPQAPIKGIGLGLGLPTVQAILKAHGSACKVSSVPGQGSVFSFTLPRAQEQA